MTLAFCSGPSSQGQGQGHAGQGHAGQGLHMILPQTMLTVGPLHNIHAYAHPVPNSLSNVSTRRRITLTSRTFMSMSSDGSRKNNMDNENDQFSLNLNPDGDDDDVFDEDALLELLDLDELERFGDSLEEYDLDELEELELDQLLGEQIWEDGIGNDDDDDDDDGTSEASRPSALEQALLQGVVPATAGVGSNCLPGDFGFDPLGLATKDYFKKIQNGLIDFLPEPNDLSSVNESGAALPLSTKPKPIFDEFEDRPPALILRDYREIEIRHGRLAMLATILWPLQEITDRLFIPDCFGRTTMLYGGTTLPFVSLFMTLVMLLLGYLDIYAASIKDSDTGDAFLPGECFWDPLRILDGAPDAMKRNMQGRELNNGRLGMIAVLSFILQEGISHQPLITLPWNQILFEPAFEIPAVQAYLDKLFAGTGKGVEQGIIEEIWKELINTGDANIIL